MKLIIANWKLHPKTVKEAQKLVDRLNQVKAANKVVICPPDIFIPVVKSKFDLGAQNIFWEDLGAHTGQVSAPMLKQFKVKYAIIGHSELRALGETDHAVNLKVKAALAAKIVPVICVGYGLTAEMDDEDVMTALQEQLTLALAGVENGKAIVAYEPVWAIGTGGAKPAKAATPEHAERIGMFIKIKFKPAKILYGGSTNSGNAAAFLERQIDGLLVGGASVDAKEFSKMISAKY